MRVLQLFGLGNTATLLTVGLRRLGVDCDMLLSNRHFITQYPEWTATYPELEDRVYMWDKSDMIDPNTTADLIRFARQYDFVVAHPPSASYAWLFGVPYACWDGGSGNFILSEYWDPPTRAGQYNREGARRGYKDAEWIFCNDINIMHGLVDKVPWLEGKYGYMPLPVDTDVFRPMKDIKFMKALSVKLKRTGFIIYLPTRQEIYWKGIDQILEGFKMFIQDVHDAQLLITKYGSDVPVVEHLIKTMELEKNVKWVDLVPKQQFAELINAVDVVIDQIKLGAIGGVTVQAMSCGQKVIVNARQDWYKTGVGEGVPIINARDAGGVYRGLIDCYQNKYENIGKRARKYVVRHHDYQRVAERVRDKIDEIV